MSLLSRIMNLTKLNEEHRLATFIFLFFVTLYMFLAGGHFYTTDGHTMHLTTESIVEKRTLAIPNDWAFGKYGRDGKFYGQYGVAFSIVEIPFYVLGKLVSFLTPITIEHVVTLTVNPLLSALICVVIFYFGVRLGYSILISAILSFAYGTGTIAIVWSKMFVNRPLSALTLLLCVYFLYKYKTEQRKTLLVFSGCFMGFNILTRFNNVIVLPALLVYLYTIGKKDSLKSFALFAMPILFAIVCTGLINHKQFGSPFVFAYIDAIGQEKGSIFIFIRRIFAHDATFSLHPLRIASGFYGLLGSIGRGLFIFVPICLLAFVSFRDFFTNHKRESILFLLISLTFLGFFSTYINWHGGRPWGPKPLFEIIPLIMLTIGSTLKQYKTYYFRAWFLFLWLVGVFINALGTLVDYHDHLYSNPQSEFLFVPSKSVFRGCLRYLVQGKLDSFVISNSIERPIPGFFVITVFCIILVFELFHIVKNLQIIGKKFSVKIEKRPS